MPLSHLIERTSKERLVNDLSLTFWVPVHLSQGTAAVEARASVLARRVSNSIARWDESNRPWVL